MSANSLSTCWLKSIKEICVYPPNFKFLEITLCGMIYDKGFTIINNGHLFVSEWGGGQIGQMARL